VHVLETLLCKYRVGPPTGRFIDVILRKSVDQVHVGTGQFAGIHHLLNEIITMVREELQVKRGDVSAGIARTSGRLFHGNALIAERHIHGLDGLDQRLTARKHGLGHEGCVAGDICNDKITMLGVC